MGKLMEDKGLIRFVYANSFWSSLSVSSDKSCSLLPGMKEGDTKGNLCPAFR